MQDLSKWYGYARKIAGSMGDDLLHHVLVENNFFSGSQIRHLDSYVYRALANAFHNRSSSFHRVHTRKPDADVDRTPAAGYDIIPVHTILLQLENEGHELYVRVFKECYFGSSKAEFSRKSGVRYDTVAEICNFVKSEIKKRYNEA